MAIRFWQKNQVPEHCHESFMTVFSGTKMLVERWGYYILSQNQARTGNNFKAVTLCV